MSIPYDLFTSVFLAKITEYDLLELTDEERTSIVDGYMKRAVAAFAPMCKIDLTTTANDDDRVFDVDETGVDLFELAEIVAEGMVVQWLQPFVFRQENLENALSTRDFTTFSPAELLNRINGTYTAAGKRFRAMMREYTYRHGDLTVLHT